jgi:uncharacterized protein (DUF1501 family)
MQLNRRAVMQGMLLSSVLCTGTGRAAEPAANDSPRLVVVFLRGGLDSLAAVPPYGDPHLAAARDEPPSPEGRTSGEAIKLDDLFALHPALAPLMPYFTAGELLIVPATAVSGIDKSHAVAGAGLFGCRVDGDEAGWLDRASLVLSNGDVGVWRTRPGDRSIGVVSDLALGSPLFDVGLISSERADLSRSKCASDLVAQRSSCEAARFAEDAMKAGEALADPAGPKLAMLELSGFDTHVSQGTSSGRLSRSLEALAGGLVSLCKTSGSSWRKTVLLVVTEFGRSVAPNGNGGTDHGTASVTFLMGGAVAGGRVGGHWPGLAPDKLHEGTDLAATTDLRSIIRGVLTDHLRLSEHVVAQVLPDAAGAPAIRGLFRA